MSAFEFQILMVNFALFFLGFSFFPSTTGYFGAQRLLSDYIIVMYFFKRKINFVLKLILPSRRLIKKKERDREEEDHVMMIYIGRYLLILGMSFVL